MAVRGPAPLSEEWLLGEYPFLPGAERWTAEFSVGELATAPRFDRTRAFGRARALAGADDPSGSTVLAELDRARPDERLLSFLYARLLLACAPSAAPIRRWAVAEAKRAYARLERGDPEVVREVAGRLGHPIEPLPAGGMTIDLAEYLHLAAPIREGAFRLGPQALRHGRVEVTDARAARLIEEAVRIELSRPPSIDPALAERVRGLEAPFFEEIARRTPAPRAAGPAGPTVLRADLFPPCVRKMRRTLESGENLSHAGRFALAAFLHRAGADEETIVDSYRGAPDFDEAITRYQVEHITHRDGGRGYEPPECATLRSHGLCLREGDPSAPAPIDRARDPRCFEESLRHPLQYYRQRGGRVREDPDRDGPTTREGAGGRDAATPRGPERTPSTGRR